MRRLVAGCAGALALAAPAQAARVHVLVVAPDRVPAAGARGLLVPGAGETVSRRGALAALLRGETRKSLLGGVPGGPPAIRLSPRPGPVTVYVSLPSAGTYRNDRRYPIAVVGGGFRGLLTSSSTRIPGLIAIADVAPFALHGTHLRARAAADVDARLRHLDRRLSEQDAGRNWAVGVLAFSVILGSLLALATRSRRVGLAALTAAPAALAVSVAVSAAGDAGAGAGVAAIAGGTLVLGAAAGLVASPRTLAAAFAVGIAAACAVLWTRPTWPALATIGPNPSEGGRFYGVSNLTETVLLTVSLFAAANLPRRALAPLAALCVVTVGWSRTGADGGGLVVCLAAFAALAVRLARERLPARGVAAASAAAILVGLAVVGLDAATGGHSHVTRKVGEGPGALLDELGNRLHISGDRIASGWHPALVFSLGIAALLVLATRGPRFPAGDALLVGLAISLLVNDTPTDVAAGGAISYGVFWAWERVRSAAGAPPSARPRRPARVPRGVRRREDRVAVAANGRGQAADDHAADG